MRAILLFLLIMILAGCTGTPASLRHQPEEKVVTLISFPPGADLELNDDIYLGRAPIVYRSSKYNFNSSYQRGVIKIAAYPGQEGYCTQEALLFWDSLPKEVNFDMSLCGE